MTESPPAPPRSPVPASWDRRIALAAALLAACERNPPRPPPTAADLAGGGVWIAHNLGCERGCDRLRRGDRILAVDGRPVSSGAELDAIGLARGEPVSLRITPHRAGTTRDVTLVATPSDPPLLTVGAAALDRAPAWAREPLFARAIPALGLVRRTDPHELLTGRQLHGRAALLVLWPPPTRLAERRARDAALPALHARLQAHHEALQRAGVYTALAGFATRPLRDDPRTRGPLPVFDHVAEAPQFGVDRVDLHAELFGRAHAAAIVILDRRGVVRFHARGFPAGLSDTIDLAVDFALHALRDEPEAAATELPPPPPPGRR